MVTTISFKDIGLKTTLILDPSLNLASTIGELSSTLSPSGLNIFSTKFFI